MMSAIRRPSRAAVLLLALAAAAAPGRASDDAPDAAPHAGEPRPGEAGHEAPAFTVAELERFGVRVATAAPGAVDRGVELPGEVRPNADRTAHVSAQFAGRVREVRVRVGDAVRRGDALATVESDTLSAYTLTAPFDGTVVDRHATPGEVLDRTTPAFVVSDLSAVWVDVHVYQKDLPAVRAGERVRLSAGPEFDSAEGTVSYVSPVLDQATRTAIARVELPNPRGAWRPGMFVTAHVLDPAPAAVLVPRAALQRLDGATVVFVVDGEHFAPRPVQVGRTGRTSAEILGGLAAGERYADDGTFLLKAELTAGGDDPHGH